MKGWICGCECECECEYVHINWSEGTVGDGAADSAGKGEPRVQRQTRQLLWLIGLDSLLDGIELGRARRRWGCGRCARHLFCINAQLGEGREREWRWRGWMDVLHEWQ
jgi:hypothetical protein